VLSVLSRVVGSVTTTGLEAGAVVEPAALLAVTVQMKVVSASAELTV
jgi:hypothetical protein